MTTKTTEGNEANQGDGTGAFEAWAIVELFGHARIAGKVSETTLAGGGFIRVDVPEIDADRPAFTRFYGPNAIYAMTPCDERVARAAAAQLRADPVTVYVPPGLLLEDGGTERCDECGRQSAGRYEGLCPACWAAFEGEDEAREYGEPPGDERDYFDIKHAEAAQWAADLLAGDDAWVILDLETTGLGDDAEIVQVGVLAPDGTVLMDTLVKPEQAIPAEATRVHGIGDEDVADAPTFVEVYDQLGDVLCGKTVVAYNAEYDVRILRQVCTRIDGLLAWTFDWLCAMTWYAQFWGDWNDYHGSFRWQKLTDACKQQGIEVEGAHSAIGDCRMTRALLRKMAAVSEGGDEDGSADENSPIMF